MKGNTKNETLDSQHATYEKAAARRKDLREHGIKAEILHRGNDFQVWREKT